MKPRGDPNSNAAAKMRDSAEDPGIHIRCRACHDLRTLSVRRNAGGLVVNHRSERMLGSMEWERRQLEQGREDHMNLCDMDRSGLPFSTQESLA